MGNLRRVKKDMMKGLGIATKVVLFVRKNKKGRDMYKTLSTIKIYFLVSEISKEWLKKKIS